MRRILFQLLFCLSLTNLLAQQQQLAENATKALEDGDFVNASTLASEGLRQISSKTSKEYKVFLDVLIESKIAANELEEAEKIVTDYIYVLSTSYGKEDTSLVSYIAAHASIKYLNGYYHEAIQLFQQSADILQKKGLSTQRDYAEIQNNMGMLYSQVGETAKAISALDISRAYFEKDASTNTFELALIYNNLADAYHNKYDYNQAEKYYKKSLNSFTQANDLSSPDYLHTQGNYALLMMDKGEHKTSINNLLENKRIAEQTLGKESPEYATAVTNLGQAYKNVGNYRLAENYIREAYDIDKVIFSVEHPSMMNATNNMAMFYYTLGQLDKAEKMLVELIDVSSKYHPDDANQLLLYTNNLSNVYLAQCKIKKAQEAAEKVVKLAEKNKGKQSVDYFQAMNSYSALLLEDGQQIALAYANYGKLSSLYNTLSKELPIEDIIAYHNNKGTAAMYSNLHTEAIKEFQAGMKVIEEVYGKQHPQYYLFQSNLGYDLSLQGKTQEASVSLLASAQNRLNKVIDLFPSLTESEKEFYTQTVRSDLSHYYVFCIKNAQKQPGLIGEMANLRLQAKSLVMRSVNETQERISKSGNQELIIQYKELIDKKKELAKYNTLSRHELNKLGVNLEIERQKTEALEKKLAQNSEYLNSRPVAVNWKSIAAGLKPEEAAIEVIRVADDNYSISKTLYYAFLIIRNGQTNPEMVVLPQGKEMEKKYFMQYRNSIQFKLANKTSYDIYWGEVAKKLSGVKHVYFSADGIYHKINLNTLQNPITQKYLIDEIQIELKGSLGNSIGVIDANKEIFLVGHPNYYLDLKEALTNYSRGGEPKARTLNRGNVEWNDLPGTKEEVGSIKDIMKKDGWQITSFTEEQAIENKVKNTKHPRVMHLATHGFFEQSENDSISQFSQEYFIDPLLRSGLALSGAGVDLAPNEIENIQFYEDGILYANEAMSLDLHGTDCVVLSACKTGLGEIRDQEGVYGLQRAFLIAGSNAVIMSLWSVDDQATKDLMVAFYGYYSKSKNLDDSFNKAMHDMQVKYKEPYYWGAFILMKK